MAEGKRQTWGSRATFILASIGSAVGLGNAWRFPGLAAKHGGGAFLVAYIIMMIIMGIPLLMMEVSIGRRMRKGAPESLRGLNKKFEPIGWAATSNAFFIAVYYSVVFAWVIMMAVLSFKFAGMTGDTAAAASLWATSIKTTGTFSGYTTVSFLVLGCLIVAWAAIYLCIRNGSQTVGKIVKYTVFTPEICLLIMAVKGLTMSGAGEGIKKLFIPDFKAFGDATLWVDAAGQVFYSLSIMMAIMFAYGSFLKDENNIAVDTVIIAISDFLTSLLSGVVLFTTMYGTGMTTANMSTSGIKTAFLIYPTAIVNLSNSGVFNAIFAFVFYLCLITLAIDSAFSIIEGVSTAVADKFNLEHKKTTRTVCIVAGILSLSMTTGAGLAILDIMDNWCNVFNLVLVGVLESIAIGWGFGTSRILKEINKNTQKFRMPAKFFNLSVKYFSPIILSALIIWNVVTLLLDGGVYGVADGYTLASNIICGWAMTLTVFVSGFIIRFIAYRREKKTGIKENDVTWDETER